MKDIRIAAAVKSSRASVVEALASLERARESCTRIKPACPQPNGVQP